MSEAPAETAEPVLVHAGNYAMFRTPAGGLHITFCRTQQTDPQTGEIVPVDGAKDEHLPELPPAIIAMMDQFAAGGERPSPMAMMRALLSGPGRQALAGLSGGSD